MSRAALSFCLIAAVFGVTAAKGATAPCSTPEILFSAALPDPGTTPPRAQQWPLAPQYASAKQSQGKSGLVWADFIVERDGHKCGVKVNSVDGPKEFAEVVSAWLAATEFSPGKKAGKPIVSEVKRMYSFDPSTKKH